MTEKLPPAELDVMNRVWQGAQTAAEIRVSLEKTRPLGHSSVCTLLKRLEDKNLIERTDTKIGKAFVYRPLAPKSRTYRSMVTSLLDRLFAGDGVKLVASLLESRPPSDNELDELEALLQRLRAERANQSKTPKESRKTRRKS